MTFFSRLATGLDCLLLSVALLSSPASAQVDSKFSVLVFSKTNGFRQLLLGGLRWAAGRTSTSDTD